MHCVVVVATARQPSRCLVFGGITPSGRDGVAAAPRWRAPHGGGVPGVVMSMSFGSLSMHGHAWGFSMTALMWMFGGCNDGLQCFPTGQS